MRELAGMCALIVGSILAAPWLLLAGKKAVYFMDTYYQPYLDWVIR